MERLTDHEMDDFNEAGCNDCSDYAWRCCKQDNAVETCKKRLIYNKLAAYEDTGLTPEEIHGLCEMDKRSRMAKMLRWGEAEEQGLLVRLPCKVGDTVYTARPNRRIKDGVVKSIHQNYVCHRPGSWVVTVFWPEYYGTAADGLPTDFCSSNACYGFESFGKTVFLTREAAEAKLKEMEGDNDAC